MAASAARIQKIAPRPIWAAIPPMARIELVPARSAMAAAIRTSRAAVKPSATISSTAPLIAIGAADAAASSTNPM